MKKFLQCLQKYLLSGILLMEGVALLPRDLNLLTLESTVTQQDDSEGELEDDDNDDGDEEIIFESDLDLIIRAVNPSYVKGDIFTVGEFIELQNLTDDALALAGYSLIYTAESGKTYPIFTFPEESFLTGKRLLLRFDKNLPPERDYDLTYAMSGAYGMSQNKGKLELFYDDELQDSVCWTDVKSATDCVYNQKSTRTIARNFANEGKFELLAEDVEYEFAEFNEGNLILPAPDIEEPEPDEDDPAENIPPQCRGLEFSELLTYYVDDKSEQFIELFNPTGAEINLTGCKIGSKNKTYDLTGAVASGGYYAYYNSAQFALTKNPQNPLTLTLIDVDGEVVDEIAYPHGQKKSTSFARVFQADGSEEWLLTYAMTPGAENIYQQFRNCEEGKVINGATGNCVKVTALKSATATAQTVKDSILAPCPAGKYRNPLTGRCKNIETTTASTQKPCAEGYERNPETNRCRKIKTMNSNDGADYALTPEVKSDHTVFVGIGIVVIIIIIGIVYVVLQFRREILRALRKARQRLNHFGQNLLARTVGRHRDKKS